MHRATRVAIQRTVRHALQYNAPLWSDSSRFQVQAIRAELRVTKSLYTSLHREARLSSHTVHAVAQHVAECACMHTRHTAPHARRSAQQSGNATFVRRPSERCDSTAAAPMHVCTGTTAQSGHARNRYNRSQCESGLRGPVRQMQRQMQPPVAHTYSADQCDIVRDWVGRSSSSALQSPGTCRHAWAALRWLAALATACARTRKQRTQWRRIPQAAADCFGRRWFQMFQTQLDDALRVHQRELNIARDNYSHEIKERRRSAQPSSAHPTVLQHAHARTRTRAQAAANMQGSFVRRRIQSVLQSVCCRLHNIVLELRGNIRVFARARPSFEGEKNHLAFPQARSRSSHPHPDPSISNRREPANTRACPCVCVYRRWQHSSGDA